MAKRKKTQKVGIISGMELVRMSRPPQDIPFRTGGHTTQKDRPRKKVKKTDIDKYL